MAQTTIKSLSAAISRVISKRPPFRGSLSVSLVSVFAIAMPAYGASESPPEPSAASDEFAEVVVTARRTSENLEKVPTVVTAFSQQQLTEQNIHTEADLQQTVPGLTVRETENQNTLTYSIRGQTVDSYTGSATAVVPYVDEIQQFSGGAGSFYDLDSIQVLKGPQGTLFGRNATGGAILYTTAKPDNNFGGYADVSYGNYHAHEEQGAINLPIVSEKVLLRVAVDFVNRDGYVHDFYHDDYLGTIARQSQRISLTLSPVEELKNTTVFEYYHIGGNNVGEEASTVSPTGTAATLYSPNLDALFGPGAWNAYLKTNPLVPAGGALAYPAVQRLIGPYNVEDITGSEHVQYGHYLVNTTTYDINSNMQLKNIFGLTHDDQAIDESSENGTPYGIQYTSNLATGQTGDSQDVKALSEEIQANGKAFNEQLQYIFGGFYQNTDTHILYPQSYFNLGPFGVLSSVDSIYKNQDATRAIYAQGTYDLTKLTGVDGLKVTAGYRYSWESINLTQEPGSDDYPAPGQKLGFSRPSWLIGLSYELTPELMAYVQSRGSWRSGGLNGVAPPVNAGASGGGDQFEPETTKDVEVGLKYGGRIFGHRAHFNMALYNQWIDNVQRAEFPSLDGHSIAITINVPAAEVSGAEFDASIQATDWLELGMDGAFTYARYTDNQSVIFGTTYIFGPYGDTPRGSGSVYGRVTLPTPDAWGKMNFRVDAYAQTTQWYSNNGNTITPGTELPGYGLVNLRYDWNSMFGSNLNVGLYMKNAANRVYYVGGLAQAVSLGSDAVSVGLPRMYGVEARYHF